ncbi:hypothetical protein F7725_028754 [Dissostichus mawsoni]|uniref:Uncharacterized protein n=1 Tax=Dissostichus mawsoni TaxID=36200 RepID=A0A7J5XGI6_DISMA|nr:hypothetical protein F7725_028754 [Dissostichus mawsoni]
MKVANMDSVNKVGSNCLLHIPLPWFPNVHYIYSGIIFTIVSASNSSTIPNLLLWSKPRFHHHPRKADRVGDYQWFVATRRRCGQAQIQDYYYTFVLRCIDTCQIAHLYFFSGPYNVCLPSMCCPICSTKWSPSIGRICSDTFHRVFREFAFCNCRKEDLCLVEPFKCPACTPDMLAIAVDGNRKHYRFKKSRGTDEPSLFDGLFIAQDSKVSAFVEKIRSQMTILHSGLNHYRGEIYAYPMFLQKELAEVANATFFCMDVACRYWPYLEKMAAKLPELQPLTEMKPFLSVMHAKAHTGKCESRYDNRAGDAMEPQEGGESPQDTLKEICLKTCAQSSQEELQREIDEIIYSLRRKKHDLYRQNVSPSDITEEGYRGLHCCLLHHQYLLEQKLSRVTSTYTCIGTDSSFLMMEEDIEDGDEDNEQDGDEDNEQDVDEDNEQDGDEDNEQDGQRTGR